jgi:hypothetical protein
MGGIGCEIGSGGRVMGWYIGGTVFGHMHNVAGVWEHGEAQSR